MAFAIDDPGERRRLDVRAKPYFVRLRDGLHLGYRKGKIVSRWVERRVIDGRSTGAIALAPFAMSSPTMSVDPTAFDSSIINRWWSVSWTIRSTIQARAEIK